MGQPWYILAMSPANDVIISDGGPAMVLAMSPTNDVIISDGQPAMVPGIGDSELRLIESINFLFLLYPTHPVQHAKHCIKI